MVKFLFTFHFECFPSLYSPRGNRCLSNHAQLFAAIVYSIAHFQCSNLFKKSVIQQRPTFVRVWMSFPLDFSSDRHHVSSGYALFVHSIPPKIHSNYFLACRQLFPCVFGYFELVQLRLIDIRFIKCLSNLVWFGSVWYDSNFCCHLATIEQ